MCVAHRHGLPTCSAWTELEVGLALLAKGERQPALERTSRAVEGLPRMHEAWIGTEQVHRAHAWALRSMGLAEEACEQARLADAVIQSKADGIPDADTRQRYLQCVQREASNLRP
jgi:hypothetical protein